MRWAEPYFAISPVLHSYKLYDHYHSYQPHIKKITGTFNSNTVWDFGGLTNSVKIAVSDEGVESHEDIPSGRILPGYDFGGPQPLPCIPDNDPKPDPFFAHGMAVTGILAASHTADSTMGMSRTSGVVGMNPNAQVIPIKLFEDMFGSPFCVDEVDIATTFIYAASQGAKVINCSWGYEVDYPGSSIISEALEFVATGSQGGQGIPIFFSAGNDHFGVPAYPSRLPYVFSVGAAGMNDVRSNYSNYGPGLDIVAPSSSAGQPSVWTTDIMTAYGANTWSGQANASPSIAENDVNYWCTFGGTSAACPIVAGVASLLLSVNPGLTSEEVYEILRESAVRKLDWIAPGEISVPHNEYGYGRVDAWRAVLSIKRGDIDNDGSSAPTISDLTVLIDHLFINNAPIFPSTGIGDIDCSAGVDITDLTLLIDHLFIGGPGPQNPCFEFDY